MFSTLTASVALLSCLASALPVDLDPRAGGPMISTSTGVQLAFTNTTAAPTQELYERVYTTMFSLQRLGQGANAGILVPRSQERDDVHNNPAKDVPVFYFAVSSDESDSTVMRTDVPGVYPLSTVIGSDSDSGSEHNVGLYANVPGTAGLFAMKGARDGIPILTGPRDGTYAVCPRSVGSLQDLLLVSYVYPGETVPADCVAGNFVLLCGTLPQTGWSSGARAVPCIVQ
ncbi:hypothetical protein PG996_006522 [Apiospora saccharicola]|uniref:DUF7907 domain-containing protein n=1 Tax=Apiospora saccharicola TaxID=335842 RepID=A0ABR1V884_9PEZI